MPASPRPVHPAPVRSREARAAVAGVRRGPVRRFAEARGLVGGFDRHHLDVRLRSADGTALVASYLFGPSDACGAVVLAHGFAASRIKPAYARLAEALSERVDVLSLDLRGHGASGGRSTLGDREHLDVAAATAWLRAWGQDRIVLVGASMGGTAVLHAASRAVVAAGVVTISAPAWFRSPPPLGPMVALDRLWRSPVRRAGLRAALGVRLAGPEAWGPPPHPVEMAASIGVPLLAVHGVDDRYFPVDDAERLAAASAGSSTVWVEPAGFGHAEDGFSAAFSSRLADTVAEVVRTGRFGAAT